MDSRDVRYEYVDNPRSLLEICIEVAGYFEDNPDVPREVSLDCEWGGGSHLQGKLRTIQFSWRAKHACVVILRRAGLVDAQSEEDRALMIKILKETFDGLNLKFIGHNIRADMLWLRGIGLDLAEVDLVKEVEGRVGFDTMLADHALSENAEHGLDACVLRYTNMGRYDVPLTKWLTSNNVKVKKEGYAAVPDELLHFYAGCDADGTLRIARALREKLLRDKLQPLVMDGIPAHRQRTMLEERRLNGRPDFKDRLAPLDLLRDVVLPCTYPINEIEREGLNVDFERMVEFVGVFQRKKVELELKFKEMINNSTFNLRSVQQVVRLLYGNYEPYLEIGRAHV
jgi:DNA polymerase I-like protein with 3'-5' exonuclease and polymerase domains